MDKQPDIFSTNILGPLHSRRLGISLGVNLLPADGKVCSFNCIYCECGYNESHRRSHFPDAGEIVAALEQKLSAMREAGEPLDVITFAGNGEPTLHPDFAYMVEETIRLRDKYYPEVKVSVLSNATRMNNPQVHAALLKIDNNILKIDGAFDETVRLIDQPADSHYSVRQVVEGMKAFKGRLIVQSMFVRGEHNGHRIDNTTPEETEAWRELMREIKPHEIQVYSLDRPTPEKNLQKVPREELEAIAAPLVAEGMQVQVV